MDVSQTLNQAVADHRAGNRAAAVKGYLAVTKVFPGAPDGWHLIGVACLELNQARAERVLNLAVALMPEAGVFWASLGHAQLRARQPARALAAANLSLWLSPDHLEGRVVEGLAAMQVNDPIRASTAFRRLLDANPDNLSARTNLAAVLQAMGNPSAALDHAERVLQVAPDNGVALAALGASLAMLGRADEAVALYQRAERLSTDQSAQIGSNTLFVLAYSPRETASSIASAAQMWGRRYGLGGVPAQPRDLGRRPIRVGYLSQDLRAHPVGQNTLPVITAHDEAKVTPYFYSLKDAEDPVARAVKTLPTYRGCSAMDDASIVDAIKADGIDILVTLAGHTAGGRPRIASFAPAPLQVWWHDLQPSGLEQVAYRFSDPVLTGIGSAREVSHEAPILLPTFYCHDIPENEVEAEFRKINTPGHVVFGSLNNPAKLSDETLACWAQILERLPDAKLLVKYKRTFTDKSVRARLEKALGPMASQLQVLGGEDDRARHLAVWNRVDVALDPFPFNGSTTSFEALWMGVPFVSLRGDRFISRVGASLLTALDLTELIAETPEAYVRNAVDLALDLARLRLLKESLRGRLRASSLMQPDLHARWMERAYRIMMDRALAGEPHSPIDVDAFITPGELQSWRQ